MSDTTVHPNFKRNEKLTFEIQEGGIGYKVVLSKFEDGETIKWGLGVNFANEESAEKAGQAILDYSYGPARPIDFSKSKGIKEDKPKVRKAPGKRNKKQDDDDLSPSSAIPVDPSPVASAAPGRIEQSDHHMFGGGN